MAVYMLHDGDYHLQKPLRTADCAAMQVEDLIGIFHSYENRRNTGKYLLTDRLLEQLDVQIVSRADAETLRDCILVTTAFENLNGRAAFDHAFWQGLLDRNVQVVPLTLGIAPDGHEVPLLMPEIVAVLKRMAQRCPLAVRGQFTADTLRAYGIDRLCVLGSPALYDVNGKQRRIAPVADTPRIINVQKPTNFWGSELQHFFRVVRQYAAGEVDVHYAAQHSFMAEMTRLIESAGRWDALIRMYLEKGQYVFSLDDWIAELKKCDFSIGSQFYGTAAALLAGVPALLLNVDARTKELSQLHGMPAVDIQAFDAEKSLAYYYEQCDFAAFERVHAENMQRYRAYCCEMGIAFKGK